MWSDATSSKKLATENMGLRRSHQQLVLHVVSIMAIDLLRQKDAWKQRWQDASQLMESLRRKYPEDHMKVAAALGRANV